MLKKIETGLQDCYIVKPSVFGDDRGYFSPFYIEEDMDKNGLFFDGVIQCNRSKSAKGVVRGLHFQKNPKCQTKLVEVIQGAAIDVVVDIREGSPTYGKHTAVLLKPYDSHDSLQIVLDKDSFTLAVNDTFNLPISVKLGNQIINDALISYTIGNPQVVSISNNVVTALSAGTTKCVATASYLEEEVSKGFNITVY